MLKTLTRQQQIQNSSAVSDNLPLGYDSIETLEEDLNYLRSVIKDIKGTSDYDSPLTKRLEEIADELGAYTAETPPTGDYSERIATTRWVQDTMVLSGGDARYVHTQNSTASIWYVQHNLGKFPSVTVTLPDNTTVAEGNVVYIDANKLEIHLSSATTGTAYIN